ncbi:MAG: RNA-binding protein [archaeon]
MKVYVGNLPFSVGHEELKNLFSSYGEITEANVIANKFSGRSKGFGFVTFANNSDGKKAVAEMNNKEIEGRALKVSEAKPFDPDSKPKRDFNRRDSGRRRF